MEFEESSWLPISALQHLLFCERQCALIHTERLWADNLLTVEGTLFHQSVDESAPRFETRGSLRICRGLPLRSIRLGLSGISDVVEFHRAPAGAVLPGLRGTWVPFPIEYKRGRAKLDLCDSVQLCAQAMCIEEMLGVEVPKGALLYGKTRRRFDVPFDDALRRISEGAARRLHELLGSRSTPLAHREKKCERCSLLEVCMPDLPDRNLREYLAALAE